MLHSVRQLCFCCLFCLHLVALLHAFQASWTHCIPAAHPNTPSSIIHWCPGPSPMHPFTQVLCTSCFSHHVRGHRPLSLTCPQVYSAESKRLAMKEQRMAHVEQGLGMEAASTIPTLHPSPYPKCTPMHVALMACLHPTPGQCNRLRQECESMNVQLGTARTSMKHTSWQRDDMSR